ncbi:hypothetical protein HMI56_002015 [Coelomomyces lativittatus]|nr:hypothetical protein HMI56_002015 [Coelomomyces lativittatus]
MHMYTFNQQTNVFKLTIRFCLELKDFNTIFELSKKFLKDLQETSLTLGLRDKYANAFIKLEALETDYFFLSNYFTNPALECLEPNDYYDAVMHFYNIFIPMYSITNVNDYLKTSRYTLQRIHALELINIFETKVIALPRRDDDSLPA